MADSRKPEFISLMRTIRDVYYREMGNTVDWMKQNSNIFWQYVQQIKRAEISQVQNVQPIDDTTHGDAFVTVDTTSDPTRMKFSFGIPEGLKGQKGDTGAGVAIKGSDTYANIILKTDAVLGDCWISTDAPALTPPTGNPAIGDGLVPLNDNPADETEWLNVGQMQGPKGDSGTDGRDGTDGTDGRNGEQWWIVPTPPSGPGDIPGAEIGDLALVTNVNSDINGKYYELFGSGWNEQGQLKGIKGDEGTPGSVWYTGAGIPSDTLGNNSDMYLDTASDNYYQKSGGTWGSPLGNIGPEAVPVGTINMYSGDIAALPSNWRLCDGTNGTPDLRGKFIMGGDGTDNGTTGGSRDAIVVEHNHAFTGNPLPEHSHTVQVLWTEGGGTANEQGGSSSKPPSTTSSVSAGTPSGSISTVGSDATDANLPPYYVLAYIMKIS